LRFKAIFPNAKDIASIVDRFEKLAECSADLLVLNARGGGGQDKAADYAALKPVGREVDLVRASLPLPAA